MNTHGACTKALTTIRRVRGYANDSSINLKAMFAAGPLQENSKLAAQLNALAENYRELEATLDELKAKSYEIASAYLTEHSAAVTKTYELTAGSPSLRLGRSKSGR